MSASLVLPLLNETKDKYVQVLQDKDAQIRELAVKNEVLQTTLKMLPEGKSPIELRQEWEVRERQQAQLQEELRSVTKENDRLRDERYPFGLINPSEVILACTQIHSA